MGVSFPFFNVFFFFLPSDRPTFTKRGQWEIEQALDGRSMDIRCLNANHPNFQLEVQLELELELESKFEHTLLSNQTERR